MNQYREEQQEEIEALRAIFDEDLTEISSSPPCLMVKLTDLDLVLKGVLSLKVTMPADYPDIAPILEIPIRSEILPPAQHHQLIQHLHETAESSVGMGMVFTLVDAAKQWILDNVSPQNEEQATTESCTNNGNDSLKEISLEEPKLTGGKWDFVIGLVGKPSAGKSTFFNAATGQNQAKTAAHPFTTIEPNIGKAYYTIPCPCAKLNQTCNAVYGHNCHGRRYIPVLMKDVAGLVPGACQGKGRGNRFLNDLLDADVLMHIIDASGCTNEKGEQTEGYDPMKDILWLQEEIHQWIYDNVNDKMDAIRRRPQKLVDMFTGYHANKALIHTALQAAGVDTRDLSGLPGWDDSKLHQIVGAFLKIRFPIYLVLNKADSLSAQANIKRIQGQHPDVPSLPVSARSECLLQELNRSGVIAYQCGDSKFASTNHISSPHAHQLKFIEENIFMKYNGTNVEQALSGAVGMRPPTYAFPVQCLDTLTAIHKYRGEPPGVLRDCIALKPGTTCEQLYTTMSHYPLLLLSGDFIRAETLENVEVKRIMRKDEVIGASNSILRIMTNRKVTPIKPKE